MNKNLYRVLPANDRANLQVVLGVLNSRLISSLYINQVTQATKDDFPQVTIKDVLASPFPEFERAARSHGDAGAAHARLAQAADRRQ